MDSTVLQTILTSTLIATIMSVLISSFVSLKLKHLDYRNEYYKKILDKRLDSYQFIENQIAVMKGTMVDDDGRAVHLIFANGKDKLITFQSNLFLAMSYGLWINDTTMDHLENLNELFFKISNLPVNKEEDLIDIGKGYYTEVATLRKQLESSTKTDIMNLHNFKKFKSDPLKRKKRVINSNF